MGIDKIRMCNFVVSESLGRLKFFVHASRKADVERVGGVNSRLRPAHRVHRPNLVTSSDKLKHK
jgi:hypothetical protein